ncbi:hypothetical protein BVRB_6g151610 [Beta vulgaris subsp. vulgaris]|nr:hypothetical protein BVRB_6g151610 [Beta vulgaris subsp. vulgaris]
MALNCSNRPMFSAHLGEEHIVQGGSQDKDICELLPADPFGMDISSTVVTALSGWFEGLTIDYSGYGGVEVGGGDGDYPHYPELGFWWNTSAMEFQTIPGFELYDDRIMRDTQVGGFSGLGFSVHDRGVRFPCTLDGANIHTTANTSFERSDNHWENVVGDGYLWEEQLGHPVNSGGVRFACTLEGAMSSTAKDGFDSNENHEMGSGQAADTDDSAGAPHLALGFALAYLGVRDLLAVERVCKSFRFMVQNDPLLWRSIHIDQPLNDRITDDILLQLTDRAEGSLQCLSLAQCKQITDDGLKRVLDGNRRLKKLSVPECTRISIDGVVSCLRTLKTVAGAGIKYLRIGGLYNVTHSHFEELMSLLDIHNRVQVNGHKPHFYHRGNFYLSCEDDRPIDIEVCPRCQNLRLIYDCPAEGCQGKCQPTELCRACALCIQRCFQCGKCINDGEYEETFCLEYLCSDCWKQVLQRQEGKDVGISVSKHSVSQEPVISFHG